MVNDDKKVTARLEAEILGREATREDWTRDIEWRLSMLFLSPSDRLVQSLLEDRLRYRAAYARPAMESICSLIENRPEGYANEIRKAREVVGKCCTIDLGDQSLASNSIASHLKKEFEELQEQRKVLYQEWTELIEKFGESSDSVASVLRSLKSLGKQGKSDRTIMLRDLKKTLTSFLQTSPDIPAIVYLCGGWITLQIHDGMEEAMAIFRMGAAAANSSLSTYLCCRILSEVYQKDGQYAKALEYSKKAVEKQRSAEACVDLTLLLAEMHDSASSKPFLEDAFLARPLTLFSLLADDRCFELGTDILDVIVRVQTRLRRDGRKGIAVWLKATKDVQEVQRIVGAELKISNELMQGHTLAAERLSIADMISAGYLASHAEECATRVVEEARNALNYEFEKRRQSLAAARKLIDSVGSARDNRIIAARRDQEYQITTAKRAQADAFARTQGLERQSIYWFGSGCGLFLLYVLTKFVASAASSGLEISPSLGALVLIISGIPIATAITLQVVYGVRRAALDIQVREKINEANKRFSQAQQEAEDFHQEQLSAGRRALIDSEAKLKRVESGFRFLKLNLEPAETTSYRLRAA